MTDYVSRFHVRGVTNEATMAYVRDYELGDFDVKLKQLKGKPYLSQMIAGETVLFVGDSYTYGTGASDHNAGAGPDTKRWSSIVASTLGCNEINVAVGSTGFVDPGSGGQNMPFITQFNNWYSNASTTLRSEVRAVFVAGGYNDVWHDDASWNTMISASRAICNRVHTVLPNAHLILIPMMWCGYDYTIKARNLYTAIIKGAQSCTHPERVCVIKDAMTWTAYTGDIASDGIHPNDNGHLHIAQGVLSGLNDPSGTASNTWDTNRYTDNVQSGATNFIERVGTRVYRHESYITLTQAVSGNTVIGQLQPEFIPRLNVYCPIYFGNAIVGTFAIVGEESPGTSGSIHIIPTQSVQYFFVPPLAWDWFGARSL